MSPNRRRRRRNIVRVHTIIISRGNRPRFAGKTVPGAAFLRLTPENVLDRARRRRRSYNNNHIVYRSSHNRVWHTSYAIILL